MLHVKHFGTIGAQNLTRHQTAAPLRPCKIDRFFGAIAEARRRRLDGVAGLREVLPDVRFARIEVAGCPSRCRISTLRQVEGRHPGT